MLNVLIVSEALYGKSLMAGAYLNDLGGEYFNIECAVFEPGPLDPLVNIVMKLDGYNLTSCEGPCTVFDLFEAGQRSDIVITICPKRLEELCPNFPGQLLRLNWHHPDPDKVAETRIDRMQQAAIMKENIKSEVVNFINNYREGKYGDLK